MSRHSSLLFANHGWMSTPTSKGHIGIRVGLSVCQRNHVHLFVFRPISQPAQLSTDLIISVHTSAHLPIHLCIHMFTMYLASICEPICLKSPVSISYHSAEDWQQVAGCKTHTPHVFAWAYTEKVWKCQELWMAAGNKQNLHQKVIAGLCDSRSTDLDSSCSFRHPEE